MTHIGYIALGSNLGDRLQYFKEAVSALTQAGITVQAKSTVYTSKPAGVIDPQPDYLNAVIRISSDLDANDLLQVTQAIEAQCGRSNKGLYLPRNLDLDIILYGHNNQNHALLTIPHPRFLERDFVLIPLSEILTTGWPDGLKPIHQYIQLKHPLYIYCESQAW